jgi:hypothetical protein
MPTASPGKTGHADYIARLCPKHEISARAVLRRRPGGGLTRVGSLMIDEPYSRRPNAR